MKIFIFIFSLCLPQLSHAFDFETLFMPDKVISGHKKLEKNCKNCHVRGRETTQKTLCLTCHKKVKHDLDKKIGFHSKNSEARQTDCRQCHTDHKGRKANIVLLDKEQFNHDETDYQLIAKHLSVKCSACHKRTKKLREAPKKCISCHKKQDVHREKLGNKCEQCHNSKSWRSESFDHDKTKFKLKRSHKKVACSLCHINTEYKKTAKRCVSCHAIKDVHKNKFGNQCASCHNESKWSKVSFRHDRDTLFKLKGAHKQVVCLACHKKQTRLQRKKKLTKARKCQSCHIKNDVHDGKNGKQCSNCHQVDSWLKTQFDHDKKTKFKLQGAHKKASCQACHQNDVKGKKTPTQCFSCHAHQDVHNTQQGKKCNQCHNDKSWWLEDVRYDHDLSDFPLLGQHSTLGCEACHATSNFKDAKKQCQNCHAQDDVHEKTFGQKCKACHNTNAWLIWDFDHDQTDFKLQDAHENLTCQECHTRPLSKQKPLKTSCISCHFNDDIHDGNFGKQCQKCHSQQDFKAINIRSMNTFGQFR